MLTSAVSVKANALCMRSYGCGLIIYALKYLINRKKEFYKLTYQRIFQSTRSITSTVPNVPVPDDLHGPHVMYAFVAVETILRRNADRRVVYDDCDARYK